MKTLQAALTAAALPFMPSDWATEYATSIVSNWEAALYVEREFGEKATTIEKIVEDLYEARLAVRGNCAWTFEGLDRDAVLDALCSAAVPFAPERESVDDESEDEPDDWQVESFERESIDGGMY